MNQDQPVFVSASHDLDEARSRLLIDDVFQGYQGGEVKFSRLKRSVRGRKNVAIFGHRLADLGVKKKAYAIDKAFSTLTKVFDVFVETVLFQRGIDVYEGQRTILAVNSIYATMLADLGRDRTEAHMNRFQRMLRDRSIRNHEAFWQGLSADLDQSQGRLRTALGVLFIGSELPFESYRSLPSDCLDLSFTVLLALMVDWQKDETGHLEVIHDASTNLEGRETLFQRLADPSLGELVVGFRDQRDLPLPLKIDRLSFENSQTWAGLKIADVIAGAYGEVTKLHIGAACDEAFVRQLIEAGFDEVANNVLLDPTWRPPPKNGTASPLAGDPFLQLAALLNNGG
ncbi:MAG: hypothetical protein AAFY47_07740 [Pseudomonadota bacterium]